MTEVTSVLALIVKMAYEREIEELGKKIKEKQKFLMEQEKEMKKLRENRLELVQKEAYESIGKCFKNIHSGDFAKILDIPRKKLDNFHYVFDENEYPAFIIKNIEEYPVIYDEDTFVTPFYVDFISPYTDPGWVEITEKSFTCKLDEQENAMRFYLSNIGKKR